MAMIEALEGRRLLSGSAMAAASVAVENDPAVVAARQNVANDQAKLTDDIAAYKADVVGHREEVNSAVSEGKQLLALDRQQIKAAKGDPTNLATAQARLTSDAAQVKATVALAKSEQKQHLAEGVATTKADRVQLKADQKTLASAIKTAKTGNRAAVQALVADGTTSLADGTFSDTEIQQLATDLRAAAVGLTKPSDASVDQLAHDVAGALADAKLSAGELTTLVTSATAVLNSAGVSDAEVRTIVADVTSVFSKVQIPTDKLVAIGLDLLAIYNQVKTA